jgi:anaerobic ribonucleoside-triphosphate reductase
LSSGLKYTTDLTGDWETDTLRTGCIGNVAINLHRIVIESDLDQHKFFDILKERFELSARALRIKYNALKQIGKNSLPFITNKIKGDTYFRFENCSRIINLVGFQEAVEKFTGKKMNHKDSQDFSKQIIKNVLKFKRKIGRKYGKRLFPVILPSFEASKRLAELDVEKFGVAKVKFSGSRYYPFFSSSRKLDLQINPLCITSESLLIEKEISSINDGGCLYVIELPDTESNYRELLKVTQKLVKNKWIEFFTYNRSISCCENCKKTWQKNIQKCPSCGSLSTMNTFNRFVFT